MNINALAVANYFIELANKDNKEIHLLGLIKRVYIAHGFSLALRGKSLLDERFDKVEAWRYGPVIPSVYHSFKSSKRNAITPNEKAVIMVGEDELNIRFDVAELTDDWAKSVCEMVWKRYIDFSDNELVTLLHEKFSPWFMSYEEGKNNPIPDDLTQRHYTRVVEYAKQRAQR